MSETATITDLCDHLARRHRLLRVVQDHAAAAALREHIRILQSKIAAKQEAAQPVVNFAAYKRLMRAR